MTPIPSSATAANGLKSTREPPFSPRRAAPRTAAHFVGTDRGAVNILKGEGPWKPRNHLTDEEARDGSVVVAVDFP